MRQTKMMQQIKAFLFDMNGTMINDMQYHISAWHRILNEFGANISMERMKEECYGKNHELIERILPGRFTEEKDKLSLEKERQYQRDFRPHLKLINGLERFLKGIKCGRNKTGDWLCCYSLQYRFCAGRVGNKKIFPGYCKRR